MERRQLHTIKQIPSPVRVSLWRGLYCWAKGHVPVRGAMRQPFCSRCLKNMAERRA